ncbi:unnamed protein product [Trichobilharzia szidati]|nr:unnamed protein product [Trichobilharzia szidati]
MGCLDDWGGKLMYFDCDSLKNVEEYFFCIITLVFLSFALFSYEGQILVSSADFPEIFLWNRVFMQYFRSPNLLSTLYMKNSVA